MFTKIEKILLGSLAVYFIAIFCFLSSNLPAPGEDGATPHAYGGYPMFMESRNVADLMDGHYTVYKQASQYTYVIHHQRGDRDFMYAVAPLFNEDIDRRREHFIVYNGKIISPPEGPTFRAA